MRRWILKVFQNMFFNVRAVRILSIIMLPFALGDTIMAERIYEEDEYYTEDWLTSPYKTREVWGEPEPWMSWGGGGAMNGATNWDYGGLRDQDKIMPFVVYGGGFDVYQRYIGSYSMICEVDAAPIITDKLNWNGTIEPSIKYFDFGGDIIRLTRKSDGYEYRCHIYPTNWLGLLEKSEFYNQAYVDAEKEIEFEKQWYSMAQAQRMVPIYEREYSQKYLGKIEEIADSRITIFMEYVGNNKEMFDKPFNYRVYLEIPEEIKPFYPLLLEELSQSTSNTRASFGNFKKYLILKNGLYLRVIERILLR